jgi:hypothetical protein
MDLASLPKGFQFPQTCLCPTRDEVVSYCLAASDATLPRLEREVGPDAGDNLLVPPLALVAWALRSAMEIYPLPAGVVHSSQEAAFYRPVRAGQDVLCDARIANRSQRAGGLFIIIDLEGHTAQGESVFAARTTIGAGLSGMHEAEPAKLADWQ